MAVRRKMVIALIVVALLMVAIVGFSLLVLQNGSDKAIRIDGNEELLSQARNHGWAGDGTEANPIIISGLKIVTDGGNGVNVSNTDLHFCLIKCSVDQSHLQKSESGFSDRQVGYGVIFSNVHNAEIYNCTIRSEHIGLAIVRSDNVSILDNSIYGFDFGFIMEDSGNDRIECNTIHDQYKGMDFQRIHDVSFKNNTCNGKYVSLRVNDSTRNYYSGNSFVSYYDVAIEFRGCSDGVFQSNHVFSVMSAMNIYGCKNESLTANSIGGPGGLFVSYSESINISNNTLEGNMVECLHLGNVSNCSVINNDLTGRNGMVLIANNSNDNIILHNTFHAHLYYYALELKNGQGNQIRQNIFLKPANDPYSGYSNIYHSQAYDDTGLNSWNDSTGGNYWSNLTGPDMNSDGLVDLPYLIDGGQGAMDNLPLLNRPADGIIPWHLSLHADGTLYHRWDT